MPNAILFDFNGVIVNDEPQHCAALIETLAEYGHTLDRDTYYRDYLGFDDRECFRYTFAQIGLPTDDGSIAEAIERKAAHYERSIRASMRLVPGAPEFVRAAAAGGHRLAIVSGALRREIDLVLGQAGLRDHFDTIVAAEDVSACKPDPEGYERAVAALGIARERCIVIEDSRPGLDAARAAGLRCAMLATSHDAASLTDADLVWDDLAGRVPADLPWSDG
ncbi:MAG: HAD family phosphatase [Gemmatimonadota bacterium]